MLEHERDKFRSHPHAVWLRFCNVICAGMTIPPTTPACFSGSPTQVRLLRNGSGDTCCNQVTCLCTHSSITYLTHSSITYLIRQPPSKYFSNYYFCPCFSTSTISHFYFSRRVIKLFQNQMQYFFQPFC